MRDKLVLLHGYKKKSHKAPLNELVIAEKRMEEVLKNEKIYA
ncbi:MAG: type II toxin-antitoxin system RelE/ParE family toxin [Proteobacteria bacterium]|nr:type II toxin-antitoxin system RelE/ParE family toxin [Pseudomonadota bacterium]